MGVKDMGQRLCRSVQGGYQRFRTAMILDIVLFFCVGVLTYRHVYEMQDWYTEEIGCAAAAAAIGCIFAVALRLFLERRGQERHGFEALLTVVVFVFFFILVQGHDWTDPYILLKTAGPALVFASVGLYCLEPQNEGEAPALVVFFAVSKAWLVGTLLIVSLNTCLTAFDSLLFSLESRLHTTLYFLIAEFSFLFIGIQVFLASLPERGKNMETPALFRALLMRVLWPVYLILLAILYLYVAKIIYVWAIPVGMMNWFASLALLAFSVFFFCFANDARYSLLQRFLRWGLLLFLPILAVQAVAVWQRVEPYGLTVLRYTSIHCTIFGIFLLVLAFLRRSPRPALLVLAFMIAAFTLTPLNIVDVPLRTQEARLWGVLEENGMLQDGEVVENPALAEGARDRLLSASEYLTDQKKTSFLETPGMRETLAKLRRMQKRGKTTEWFEFQAENPVCIPVDGWKKAYRIDNPAVEDGVIFVDKGDGTKERFDVSVYLEELLAYAHKEDARGTGKFTRELRIDIDENTCLWLYDVGLSVRNHKGREDITAQIKGVLLKR
ncbi:MAG: DUF4153 domain-containing protein [Selenomonas sp.]